jgi:glycosyltransferase involved in cell wall biosynthesis
MRIAWVAPTNRRSAIGRMAVATAEALARRGHDIEIVRAEAPDARDGPTHATDLPVRLPETLDFRTPRAGYDLAVVHIGDFYPFHAAFFDLADRAPCLGVFHDFYLFNLFAGWLHANDLPPEVQDGEVAAVYGVDAVETARRGRRGAADLQEIADKVPMTEWIARRCVGALAHSGYYLDRLGARCAGPVDMAHLPWEGRDIPPLAARAGSEVRAITVGVMNPNKCVDAAIEAICASPTLKSRLRYTLAGPIEPAEQARLQEIAAAGGYEGLTILGPVDDARLEAEIAAADIVCCLRKPVLEGASASAIEGMLSGRPTVVVDAGFYGELPDDLVFKVPRDVPQDVLTRVLERLAGDEALRRSTGEAARAWAETHFSIERYTDKLETLMQATVDALPLLGLGAAVGRELRNFGLSPEDPAVARIAARSLAMLGSQS